MNKLVRTSTLLLLASCESALYTPSPIASYAPGRGHGRSADQLLAEADLAWSRRADPGQAESAQGLYLDAAVADPHRVDGLLGAMRALTFRIEYEHGVDRGRLAQEEVELGQWCQRAAPARAECDYRLAIALGQQARERPSTGQDAMKRMVDLLHRAIAAEPRLDDGGPHRVLALILLRAPGWPVGPGDADAALAEAQAAVRIAEDAPANQLVLAEALAANDHSEQALAAYRNAASLTSSKGNSRDPEVVQWRAEARKGIEHTGG
jgi:hypothetical protein